MNNSGTKEQVSPEMALNQDLIWPHNGELGAAPGSLVVLPSGGAASTHYQLEGCSDASLVVLVNGVNDFSIRYNSLARALTVAGFRVLRYDAYGRGWSDIPQGAKFDAAMHVQQLEELLEHIGAASSPLSVLAHSMGAITAVLYAGAHPRNVRHLVLMAPAGVMKSPLPGFTALQSCFRCCSCLQSILANQGDPPPGDFYNTADSKVQELSKWDLAWTRAHLKANSGRAFAASVAHMPLTSMESHVRALGKPECSFPVLLLMADHDPHVALRERDLKVYREGLGARFSEELFADSGHCFFLEKEELVTQSVLNFLSKK